MNIAYTGNVDPRSIDSHSKRHYAGRGALLATEGTASQGDGTDSRQWQGTPRAREGPATVEEFGHLPV